MVRRSGCIEAIEFRKLPAKIVPRKRAECNNIDTEKRSGEGVRMLGTSQGWLDTAGRLVLDEGRL